VPRIRITDLVGHVDDAGGGLAQQSARLFHTQFDVVLRGRQAGRPLEQPVEMECAHAGDFRQRRQVEGLGQMLAHPQRNHAQLVGRQGQSVELRCPDVHVMSSQVHGDAVGHAAHEAGARGRLRELAPQASQQGDQLRKVGRVASFSPKARLFPLAPQAQASLLLSSR